MNTDEIVARLREFAQARAGIVAVYVYGSHASGAARQSSDIDVAVLFEPSEPDALDAEIQVEGALHALPGLAQVEVVALNRAPLGLKAEVLQTGMRVYCHDDEARTAFEFDAMRQWWDWQPWHAAYDREYFASVKENFTDDQRRSYQRARQTLAATD